MSITGRRVRKWRDSIAAAGLSGGAIVAFGLAVTLGACQMPAARSTDDVANAAASVRTAVGDAEEIARRARAYDNANIWIRAAHELEEAEVVLRKARDQRERIRAAHQAALAVLAAARGPDVTQASDRVDRIGAVLAATDRHIATIEQTFAAVKDLDIPNRR